jgi:hypothetical protein
MNKYLEKLATVIDKDEHGNTKIYEKGSKYAKRADKAKLINPPAKNKLLKRVLIGGAVAKAGITGGLLYAAHKKHQQNLATREQDTLNHVKQAKAFHNATGEPGATINANSGENTKRDLLQTGVGVGSGFATHELLRKFEGGIGKGLGGRARAGVSVGAAILGDYGVTRVNNKINEKFNAS